MRTFAPSLLALAALAGSAQAQSLDADVVRDPNAGLAIYTATIDGPPGGGAYFLYASLNITPPFFLPGVIGTIHLDPLTAVYLNGGPLLPSGLGVHTLTLPLAPTQDLTLGFQSLIIDPVGQLAVTDLASALQGSVPTPQGGLSYENKHQTSTNNFQMRLSGTPGTQVRLLVNGGAKLDVTTNLDGSGNAVITQPVLLGPGDGFVLEEFGIPVSTWSHY